MGSSNSRLGRRQSRLRTNRTRSSNLLSSLLLCGGSSSRASLQMENHQDEIRVSSTKHFDEISNEIWNSSEERGIFVSSVSETGTSSGSRSTSAEDGPRNTKTSNQEKCSSEIEELVSPYEVNDSYGHDEFCRNRNIAEASSLVKDQECSDPVSLNVSANKDASNGIDNSENKGVSHICPGDIHASNSSSQEIGDSHTNDTSVVTHIDEATWAFNSDPMSHVSDIPSHDNSLQEAIPSGLEFLVANREQSRGDGSVLHLDVVSISSSILSRGNTDSGIREARRNSRRLFWDAFSRRSSRRHLDSPTVVFSTDNSDDLLSHDRWLLDFSGDMFDDGIGSDSGYLGSRIHALNGRRRHSRSEMWERLRGGLDEHGQRTTSCPSGLHPDGMCSCESFSAEETGNRASISRIVMLAEALFEVLDEIHRQPVSLSLSMMSVPAPESVVDSFPIKSHKNDDKVKDSEDVEQCYICLAEYEEGDKIRVLPCHHEYHMSCIDKWLKEIHGVCPLCRGDVRQGTIDPSVSCSESSASNSETPV